MPRATMPLRLSLAVRYLLLLAAMITWSAAARPQTSAAAAGDQGSASLVAAADVVAPKIDPGKAKIASSERPGGQSSSKGGAAMPGVETPIGAGKSQAPRSTVPAAGQKGPAAPAKQPAGVQPPVKPSVAAKGTPTTQPPAAPALPELTPAMTAIRDRLRWTLTTYLRQPMNTRDNTTTDILHACMAYGCDTEVQHDGQTVNGITCLCWNYPCAGYELLQVIGGRIGPRVGYALQSRPGELLAVMALGRVPGDYPVRVGQRVGSVASLIEFEELSCRSGSDQSLRLVGLAHYVPNGQTWKNDRGEEWSVERLIKEEIEQPVVSAPYGGTQRLLGLGCAVNRLLKSQPAETSQHVRARKFLDDYYKYAFRIQNSDGSWHPLYFAAIGRSNDTIGQLAASAHIAQWLAVSLPAERLEEPAMVRSIEYLTDFLVEQQARWNVPALSTQAIDAVTCTLSALRLYDQRVFKPYDAEKPEKPEKEAAQ